MFGLRPGMNRFGCGAGTGSHAPPGEYLTRDTRAKGAGGAVASPHGANSAGLCCCRLFFPPAPRAAVPDRVACVETCWYETPRQPLWCPRQGGGDEPASWVSTMCSRVVSIAGQPVCSQPVPQPASLQPASSPASQFPRLNRQSESTVCPQSADILTTTTLTLHDRAQHCRILESSSPLS